MAKNKILIIRLSSLGDIIHTFPMLSDFKLNNHNSTVDWLVDESFEDVVKFSSNVDNILTIPLRKWKKNKLSLINNLFNWYKTHNLNNYDYIIDSQGLIKSAILTRFFIGNIYGYSKHSVKEKFATLFYDYKINIQKDLFAINKNRLLLSKIFNYPINLQSVDFGVIQTIQYNKIAYNNYVIFFHCTSINSKKVPVSLWHKFAEYLISKKGLNIILPYGNEFEKGESLLISNVIKSSNVIVPEYVLNYNQIFNLIQNAHFIIGVDTGLIHLSNALKKELIAIFVSTDFKKTGIFETTSSKNFNYINNYETLINIINYYESLNL